MTEVVLVRMVSHELSNESEDNSSLLVLVTLQS